MRKVSAALICLGFILLTSLPMLSQENTEESKDGEAREEQVEGSDQVYHEVTLEDFENTQYTDKNIDIRVVRNEKAGLAIREEYPAPIQKSSKYLGVKVFGRNGRVATITPSEPYVIKKHCKTINAWVYGKKFSGELSIILKDAAGRSHRLVLGKLNFLGWRKLSIKLTDEIAQEDKYLSQERQMEILKIMYNPGNTGRVNQWNYFYIDDITVVVREKYMDRQSDDW